MANKHRRPRRQQAPGPVRGRPPNHQSDNALGGRHGLGGRGLVVIIIVALVIVKATSSSSTDNSFTPVTPAPASVVHDVTNIPLSVYNTVGVTSPTVPVAPPTILRNQPPMTLDGKSPAMLYYGAEYCPDRAAERWAMTAALSRFGTWSDLKITASSHSDVDPATNTFSFHGATLTSPYLTFRGSRAVHQRADVDSRRAYTNLQNPTAEEKAILTKYSSSKFNPNATTTGGISFPFVNINNVALISGASYSPGILAGQTWSQIAGGLTDPTNPTTQAIVATANYMSAAICASTKGAPASVCTQLRVQGGRQGPEAGLTSGHRGAPNRCPRCGGSRSRPWCLSIAGLGIAIYLTITHFDKVALVCSDSGTINCSQGHHQSRSR